MNPKPGRGGSLPHLRQNDVIRLWSQSRRSARAIAVKLASHFGREEHIRAARLCSVDRLHHRLRVALRINTARHLANCGAHQRIMARMEADTSELQALLSISYSD